MMSKVVVSGAPEDLEGRFSMLSILLLCHKGVVSPSAQLA